jgi:hypothetical protein
MMGDIHRREHVMPLLLLLLFALALPLLLHRCSGRQPGRLSRLHKDIREGRAGRKRPKLAAADRSGREGIIEVKTRETKTKKVSLMLEWVEEKSDQEMERRPP